MATKDKKPKARRNKKPEPLTASDYLLFNEMISRIRALELVATERFMRGKVDRSQLAKSLGTQVDRIQTKMRLSYGRCHFPYCNSGGVCELCFMQMFRKQLERALGGMSSKRT